VTPDLRTYPQVDPDAPPGKGYPGNLTAEQEQKLAAFRGLLESKGYKDRLDDATLLRFLRARKFDLELTMKMYVDNENWRKEFGTDQLPETFKYTEKAEMSKYYPQYYHQADIDGRPVYIEQLGKVDLTAMYKITTEERMMKNLVFEYENYAITRLPACSRRMGRLIETSCTIMDLKGVGLTRAYSVYGYIKKASAISQNYYPERMGKLYLINAPWGFASVFNVIKGYLDPVTIAKIHVLGSSYQSELHQQVPKENLPASLGGTCTCSSAGGCIMSDKGPWQDPKWSNETWTKKADTQPHEALEEEWKKIRETRRTRH